MRKGANEKENKPRNAAPLQGWPFVERRLEQAHERNRTASNADDFAAVGHACAEALSLLVHAVYVLDREQFKPRGRLVLTDSALDLLRRYISQRLTGSAKEV